MSIAQTTGKPGRRPVLVIYGGRSAEHEVSCRSAAFILRNLDPQKYEVHALAIDKSGQWLPQKASLLLETMGAGGKTVPILAPATAALPTSAKPKDPADGLLDCGGASREDLVVFPVLHGSFGEDGTIQGMLDLVS